MTNCARAAYSSPMRRLAPLPLLLALAACGGQTTDQSDDEPSESASATESAEPEEQEAEIPGSVITKTNVRMAIRETSKQCYGEGVGCNVEYRVTPELLGVGDPTNLASDYEISYEVRGADTGPITDTVTVYRDGQYEQPYENSVSTRERSIKMTVEVTGVLDVG